MATKKGIKRIKNQPVFYEELKKQRGVNLTDTVWNKLTEIAIREEISRSEVIERIVRNLDGEKVHEPSFIPDINTEKLPIPLIPWQFFFGAFRHPDLFR